MKLRNMEHRLRPEKISLVQGLYYTGTGIWPLLSPKTFQFVTGPKTDFWLVKTLGTLITVVGGVLLLAGYRQHASPEVRLLAVGSAAGLAACDVTFVARRRISAVYLLDAAFEVILLAFWAIALGRQRPKEFEL